MKTKLLTLITLFSLGVLSTNITKYISRHTYKFDTNAYAHKIK